MSDPRVVSALTNLADAYDVTTARRRLVQDVDRMPRTPVLRRPRINTFQAYNPTRPVNQRRPAQATPEADVHADAPSGESFWLMVVGGLGLCFFAWLAWWVA